MTPQEGLRRRRLGDIRRLLRYRLQHCRQVLPDDDAGREYLHELLLILSLGAEPERKMTNAIEVHAPWMERNDAALVTDMILSHPEFARKVTARELGDRLRVTNAERELLDLRTIKPIDMTDAQLEAQRKAKDRARKALKRQKRGCRPRAEYLTQGIASAQPWKVEGIGRTTWYERQKKLSQNSERLQAESGQPKPIRTSVSPIKLLNYCGTTCPAVEVGPLKAGQPMKRNGRKASKEAVMESKNSEHGLKPLASLHVTRNNLSGKLYDPPFYDPCPHLAQIFDPHAVCHSNLAASAEQSGHDGDQGQPVADAEPGRISARVFAKTKTASTSTDGRRTKTKSEKRNDAA